MIKYSMKCISFLILVLFVIISGILVIQITSKVNRNNKELHKEFVFEVKLYKNNTIQIQEFTDKPFLIYFADYECDACKYEIYQLNNKINKVLEEYNILFITELENPEMMSFLKEVCIYPNSGVFIGVDDHFEISDYYKVKELPTILILDENFIARKKLSSLKPILDKL